MGTGTCAVTYAERKCNHAACFWTIFKRPNTGWWIFVPSTRVHNQATAFIGVFRLERSSIECGTVPSTSLDYSASDCPSISRACSDVCGTPFVDG